MQHIAHKDLEGSELVYTTESRPVIGFWMSKKPEYDPRPIADRECYTKLIEPHLLGEFPDSCYRCHLYADA